MKFLETTGFTAVASVRSLSDGRPVLNKLSKRQRSSFRNLKISDWKIHAALIEVESIEMAEEPEIPPKLTTSCASKRLALQVGHR